ncbi:sulfide/dihydroorotate dehydrogenase-like FAD/NAD-binding protein [Desulfurobacterium atlanticum]|uniref:Sulfide dehydrogenase (Flavoprotein) subunit SudB n=1 Tax=Desulfurobacterium atlanticum TaxID=240169 RepID=A0A238YIS0_9BACT|nr:sulfide/dihydroorotate dehydrogenase-like FAD/NAD-binding protein [Desulfurobacterium atlanticum]SNR70862.1 sulfide dehydrogenase (flavoprotein) subunit SudB [Desulfurobacterium atlanticum]
MYRIVKKRELAENVDEFVIEAPEIAQKAKPGQFVIIRISKKGERIPLTIAEKDPEFGTITLMVQRVGKTTFHLSCFEEEHIIPDVVGPLGKPTHIEKWGHVVCIGGGLGLAPIHHIAQGVKEAGNEITTIMGFRRKDLVFWEDKMKLLSDKVIVTTNDGSYGMKGLVTDALQKLIDDGVKIDMVITAGPVPMMKAVAELTKKYEIPTVASLNPIMVDGTGMCGACRVTVDGEVKFACVDGPEFDAHKVDFDELINRLNMFKTLEAEALKMFQKKHCGCGKE